MRIIVTENHFEKILKLEGVPSNVIQEQFAVMDEKNVITIIQQKINELISDPKKEKPILDGIRVKIKPSNDGGYVLQIGNTEYTMGRMAQGIYALIIPAGKGIPSTTLPMSSFMSEIEKFPEYKNLVDKRPEIKSQIQNGKIFSKIYADNTNQGFFKFTRLKDISDRKEKKLSIPIEDPYPLGEFMLRKKINFIFPDGTYGVLETEYLMADLVSSPINIVPPKQSQKETQVTQNNIHSMGLGDVFNLDDITFKDEGKTIQQINPFIQHIKGLIDKYGSLFIEHIKSQNPTIYGFSSIDGDPNQQIIGKYKPCSGNSIRKEYDLCLSKERAKVIAELLNQSLPELDGVFQSKGMGETTKWGVGWTQESPTIPEQTAPNRRYVLSPIKPYIGGNK